MLALGMREIGEPELLDIAEPALPGEGELLVDVEMVALSIAEVRAARGDRFRHFGQVLDPAVPFVFGFAGVARVALSRSNSVQEGTRVILSGLATCGHCSYCRRGLENHCENMLLSGIDIGCPGFARQRLAIPARRAFAIPDAFPPEHACVVSEVATAIHALDRGRLQPGERLGIVGAGRHGRQFIRVARRLGCFVVAIDSQPEALARARDAGADEAIPPEVTPSRPLDVVVHANSDETSLALCCDIAAPGGRIVLLGTPAAINVDLPDPSRRVIQSERELIATDSKTAAGFRRAIEVMATGNEDWDIRRPRRVPLKDAARTLKEAARSWPPKDDLFIDMAGGRA